MGREKISLNNNWKFHLGDVNIPLGDGYVDIYMSTKAGGVRGPAEEKWNCNNWKDIDVPHDWAIELDFDKNEKENLEYKSKEIAWYRKSFLLDKKQQGKHILLEFDGIAGNSTIYFNGSIVERNGSSYNSFSIDVSERAHFGDTPNILAVKVDGTLWEGWWYEGAGIYRNTWLTQKELLHIDNNGLWVNPKKINTDLWNTHVEITIENSSYTDEEVIVVSKIYDNNDEFIDECISDEFCKGGEKKTVNQLIEVKNPELWDIENPTLYKVISEIYINGKLIDSDKTIFGYRTIRICPDKGFYLNEKPIKLKGTCNHQDHGGLGVAVPYSIHEYRIKMLKEMGSNAYRCAHNWASKELLNVCDRIGMLVIDENRKFETSKEVINQVKYMVKSHRNHPCVSMYSIFNEEPLQGTLQGRNMANRIKQIIKSLDDTRPIVGAMHGGVMEEHGASTVLDATGLNYQLWLYDDFHKKYPKQPVFGSETCSTFSTRGVYENNKENQEFSSYNFNRASWGERIRETWKAVNTRDFVMGMFAWTGFDYLGEPTPFKWPSVSSFFGALDLCGIPKDGYYLYKALWTEEPIVHLLPHWNWQGKEGQKIKVMTYSNCEEVELILNDRVLEKKEFNIYEQGIFEVPYESGKLMAKGYKNGKVVAESFIETSSNIKTLKIEPYREYIFGDNIDTIAINISAVDYQRRFVPTANNKIKFSVKGLGEIIGVSNGNPNCHESFKEKEISLFNGRCQCIVKSLTGVGTITLTVAGDGLDKAEYNIEVRHKEISNYSRVAKNYF